ncbi:MAG: hypothetical protein K940chlam7_01049 [Chlamydiae bacterium]|nr:hypothetical protein [Chlamydiota bacterium]
MNTNKSPSLLKFVENLHESGTYCFSFQDVTAKYRGGKKALQLSISRLISKKRIVRLHHQFFAIVPIEYREIGSSPPSWFIDSLMRFLKQPYYVGLLSAAAIHGAAHHHPQEFQVITNRSLKPFKAGLHSIRFLYKKDWQNICTEKMTTETGSMLVSTPELTAFDLVRYYKSVGHFNNVATVLIELSEKIDSKKLVVAAQSGVELSVVQRLGYLMDRYSEKDVTKDLCDWLMKSDFFYILLRPDIKSRGVEKNVKWRVWINENIEADL